MTYEKTNYFHKKMVITEKRLKELDSIMYKYSDSVEYKATLKDKTTVEFNSFDELLNYDNYGNRKIRTLIVEGRSEYSTIIQMFLAPSERYSKETARYSYKFKEKDKETTFLEEINHFFSKAVEYEKSDAICEWFSLALILSLAVLLVKKLFPITPDNEIIYMILFVGLFALMIYKTISYFVWDRLFPDVVFAWGEEKERYEELDRFRSNVFWGVIVAFAIGVVLNIVFN